ncbi:MAG: cation:proton antiporter regulatory subunit [Christensenellaceae bacterium]
MDVNPRRKYDINILTIKKGHKIVSSPNAEYVFEDGDHMVVFGNTEKILAFTNKRKK